MIKLFFLTASLITSTFAQANNGSLLIQLKSAIDIEVTAPLVDVSVLKTQNGFAIDSKTVKVDSLSVKPGAAKGNLRSEKFLDAESYPDLVVSQIHCAFANESTGWCKGLLKVKGTVQPIQSGIFEVKNNELKIQFRFSLSQYSIARKVIFFKINDSAKATVRIQL